MLVSAVLLVYWRSSIPHYGGKTTHGWLNAMAPNRFALSSSSWMDTREAFEAMGPRAMPYVVDWMREGALDGELGVQVYKLANRTGMERFLPPIVPQPIRIETGMRLLEELGPKAIGARKELEELFQGNELQAGSIRDSFEREFFQVIGSMGIAASNSGAVVAKEFFSTNSWKVDFAVDVFNAITPSGDRNVAMLERAIREGRVRAGKGLPVLARLGVNYEEFLPSLAKQLLDTNHQGEAILATKKLGLEKELFVPHAAEILRGQPFYTFQFLKDLARLGLAARPAAEVVRAQLSHEAEGVREEAAKTLMAIAPEMTEGVGTSEVKAGVARKDQ